MTTKILESEIEKLQLSFACLGDASSPERIRSMIDANTVRYSSSSSIKLGHMHCAACNELMSVMMLRTESINIFAAMTHQFHNGSLHMQSGVDPITADILLSCDAEISYPMFVFNIAEYQRGFLNWIYLHIASEPTLRAQHKKWKLDRVIDPSKRASCYCNICEYCNQPVSDITLLTAVDSPFAQNSSASNLVSLKIERPLFLKGNLHPIDTAQNENEKRISIPTFTNELSQNQ